MSDIYLVSGKDKSGRIHVGQVDPTSRLVVSKEVFPSIAANDDQEADAGEEDI